MADARHRVPIGSAIDRMQGAGVRLAFCALLAVLVPVASMPVAPAAAQVKAKGGKPAAVAPIAATPESPARDDKVKDRKSVV